MVLSQVGDALPMIGFAVLEVVVAGVTPKVYKSPPPIGVGAGGAGGAMTPPLL